MDRERRRPRRHDRIAIHPGACRNSQRLKLPMAKTLPAAGRDQGQVRPDERLLMLRIMPDERYSSMPSADVGGEFVGT